MEIREFSIEDLRDVVEIERLSFEYPYSKKIFKMYAGSELFLVALAEGEVVGYVIGEVRDGEGWIISVAVDPDFRRDGVGTELMQAVMERMDVSDYFLTVRVGNRGAMEFYSELGFEPVGLVDGYYENGDDAVLMKK
ncbi:MAG: ribosomal protein S18-alanine N-acetyltransferase [Candidatus Natronoplasma sp.]